MILENPLEEQIKQKYPNIYAAAWSINVIFQEELALNIGKNEVAYLALYFGGAIERAFSSAKALIVCNYGVGVSQILKEKLQRSIQGLEITGVKSTQEIEAIRHCPCDFLIATVPLEDPYGGKKVIMVDSFLLPQDEKAIRDYMAASKKNKIQRMVHNKSLLEKKELFSQELVLIHPDKSGKDEVLEALCTLMSDKGYVSPEFTHSVYERELITSTEIGHGVAIPHGNAKLVIQPVIAVAILKEPITWYGKNKVDTLFLLALNLDEKFHMKEKIIKFYSTFVAMLEDQARLEQLKAFRDNKALSDFMNQIVKGDEV